MHIADNAAKMSLLKKNKVPDELPELAIDEIKERLSQNMLKDEAIKTSGKNLPLLPKDKGEEESAAVIKNFLKESEKISQPVKENKIEVKDAAAFKEDERGFFKEIINEINSKERNIKNIDSLYNRKLISGDIVNGMKEYWEKQKPGIIIQNIGRNFRDKINEKTSELQKLEKEWQAGYFQLVEKEEDIREKDKELKELLSEFVKSCKKKTESKR